VVDAVPLSVALEDAYYIHAGTFGSEAVARKEQQRLANLGEAVELSVLQSGERTYYRLRVGPFHDRLAMNKRRNALRRLGVDTLLVKAPKN
jgi:Cell division protein